MYVTITQSKKLNMAYSFPGSSDSKASACNAGDLVHSLGQEDPLEKRMAAHSNFLPGEFCGQRGLAGCSPRSCKRVGPD